MKARGKRVELGGGRQRVGELGIERDFPWGDGHTMPCVDALLSCTLETCMVL